MNNDLTYKALIQGGEREWLEFKTGVLFRPAVLIDKVSYFVNNTGGILIIGLSDAGEPIGLKDDYRRFKDQKAEYFLLKGCDPEFRSYRNYLKYILKSKFGRDVVNDIQIDKVSINNKEICVINVGKFEIGGAQMTPEDLRGRLPSSAIHNKLRDDELVYSKQKIANLEQELKVVQKKPINLGLKKRNTKSALAKEHCINVLVKALSHYSGAYNIRGLLRDDKVKWYQDLDFGPHPKPRPRTLLNYYNNNKDRFKKT